VPFAASATQLETDGDLTFDGTTLTTGNIIATGTLRVDNGATLGDGTSDAHTINGYINSATGQPGFLAYNSVDDAGVGSSTLEFDTEAFDTAGNFNNTTDTFTAPVTGKYHFCANMRGLLASGSAAIRLLLVTTSLTYSIAGTTMENPLDEDLGGCVTVALSASDTAKVDVQVGASTLTVYSDTGTVQTYFSGRLVP
jgi:hypothetical protein